MTSLLPKVTFEENLRDDLQVHKLPPFVPATSAFECAFERDMRNFESLSAMPTSAVTTQYDMDFEQTWQPFEFLFGPGVILSNQNNRLHVTVLDNNIQEKASLAAQLLNNTQVVDLHFTIHGRDTHYFIHSDASLAEGVIRSLNLRDKENRHGMEITVQRIGRGPESVDIRLHGNHSVFNVRYGTTISKERTRILKHAKQRAITAAWEIEKQLAHKNQDSPYNWNGTQKQQLITKGLVPGMEANYIRDIKLYPALADDPKNIKFIKSSS